MTERQDFLGGVIVKAVAEKAIEAAIKRGVKKAAKSPHIEVADEAKTIEAVTQVTAKEVREEVDARIEHMTDTEPHRSSRNVWGSIVGIVTAAEILRMYWMDDQTQTIQEWLVPVGAIITALTPLYSRFIARKPIMWLRNLGKGQS